MTNSQTIKTKNLIIKSAGSINRQKIALSKTSREFKLVILFSLLHIPLGILLYNSSALALLHPVAVFCAGVYFALNKKENLERTVLIGAYIIGAEVLWRMAESSIFWEFGKYSLVVLFSIALLRRSLYSFPSLPIVYFICLVPACILTLISLDMSDARGKLSFNMSGPLSLVVCCWFFSHLKLNGLVIRRLFLAIILPLISVGCTTLFYTVSNPDINFGGESNYETSGGFGPNQVSSLLGLGVFAAAACFIAFRNNVKYQLYFGIVVIFLSAQSVLTFSRGGMYNAVGSIVLIALFSFQNAAEGIKRIAPFAVVIVLFLALVFPFLDNFTGGKLQERFENTSGTNRAEVADSDIEMFFENPILGVGVGISKAYRKESLGLSSVSHTEFTRILSEHGAFGVISLLAMFAMTILNFKKHKVSLGRALTAGAVAWAILFMMNAGMRLAAPAFIFGMSFLSIAPSYRQINRSETGRNSPALVK